MVGITSYGAYVPMLRLPLAAIGGGSVKPGGPEKAVANWDEDAVTMAVAAAIDCLRGVERASVDGVLFASTSYPLKEKQAAALVARALDLRRDVVTVDVADSLRSGTTALRTAIDAVKAGSAKRVLVVAGEARLAAPRSALEPNLGDGAAAFLVGADDVAVAVAASHTVADEIIDVWRTEGDPFVHAWEDRFVVDHGYGAEAFVLETTPVVERLEGRRGVGWHLARRAELPSYDLYLRFRQLLATEHDRRAGAGISATKHFRDRDDDVTLAGLRCRRCGCVQYPRQRVCFRCHARDDFERVRLSDKIGALKSFTFDNFAGSPSPPLIASVVDVEGARLYLQVTDASPKEVQLDLPVELVFRKMHDAGGTPNYYWKCTPVR